MPGWRSCCFTASPTSRTDTTRWRDHSPPVGAVVVVPRVRGYGLTRFVDGATARSGQQVALVHDLFELISALGLRGQSWAGSTGGGRAACLVAALWPESVARLLTVDGYSVQDITRASTPMLLGRKALDRIAPGTANISTLGHALRINT